MVTCRIGSSEIIRPEAAREVAVTCRIGSSESCRIGQRHTFDVTCRIGSSENGQDESGTRS